MSEVLFHQMQHSHTHTHTEACMHTTIILYFYLRTHTLHKKKKLRGKLLSDKRGCALRRNQHSFRLSLSFHINVASHLEVEGEDRKITVKPQRKGQPGASSSSVSFFFFFFIKLDLRGEWHLEKCGIECSQLWCFAGT